MRVVAANPVTMAIWGMIVAGALVIGSLPLFFGLTIVVPILGHATWHLYRKVGRALTLLLSVCVIANARGMWRSTAGAEPCHAAYVCPE